MKIFAQKISGCCQCPNLRFGHSVPDATGFCEPRYDCAEVPFGAENSEISVQEVVMNLIPKWCPLPEAE